jgi:hypothetical protein
MAVMTLRLVGDELVRLKLCCDMRDGLRCKECSFILSVGDEARLVLADGKIDVDPLRITTWP